MVRNPSRFSGSTGLRQNIVRNAAPKITPKLPPVTDYADPSVEPSQGYLEADASNHDISDDSLMSLAPAQQSGYDEKVKNAEPGGHWSTDTDDKDDKVDYRANNRMGGISGLWNNRESGSSGTGNAFVDFANMFKRDEDKQVLNPTYEVGVSDTKDKFITKYSLATEKADAAAAVAAAEDKKLADIKAVENALHSDFSTFYVGGVKDVNPNQVKFDELRKDTLTKDNKATGVMQNVDGVAVFQSWTDVASNYGPNVKVNYGLYGDPMNPTPGSGPSGTMTIGRSLSEGSHAGIQTAINKQQANRDFNNTIKTWQSEYLLGARDDAAKVKAKNFIDAQKKKYLEWGDQGGHGIGGYGEMFGKELDKRYYNLFDSPNSPGQNNKWPNRKLTVAEKIKIKIDNGTATQAEIKRYAILTRTPGTMSGVDLFTGAKSGVDPTMGYSNFLGDSESWY